ncbi:hypothetical protein BJ875DRAFT_474035 [Amylocarpus encephaloides]|uniref:AA1-like domain-containing protein n=1 Tax=Amylocarpus encephaloides TaxID=45428 RepID=A0A9P7Y9Q8_9HELO|nr:hypothetical protein BJ875DRAFT_474035 [Amylocarpus encephaloides]
MLYSIIFGLAATTIFANGTPTATPENAPVISVDILPENMATSDDVIRSTTHVPLDNTAITLSDPTAMSGIYSNYDLKTNCEITGFDPKTPGVTPAPITLVAPEWDSIDFAPRVPLYDIIPGHVITKISCKPKEKDDGVMSLVFKGDGNSGSHQWEVEDGGDYLDVEEEEFTAISFSSTRAEAKDNCTVNGEKDWASSEGGVVVFKTPVKVSEIACDGKVMVFQG